MSILVRLYPREWRDRYEPEFLDVLESRPPNAGDRLDIVRGAIDARLNPGVPGAPAREPRAMRPAQIAGISALVGGVAYLGWTAVIVLEFRGWDQGVPEHASLGMALAVVTGLALAVAHAAIALADDGTMRRFGAVAASIAAVCFTMGAFVGGSLLAWAFIASMILAVAVAGRTIPIVFAVVWSATTLLALVAMIAFVASEGRDLSLLVGIAPMGPAWILLGLFVTVRGMPSRPAENTATPTSNA